MSTASDGSGRTSRWRGYDRLIAAAGGRSLAAVPSLYIHATKVRCGRRRCTARGRHHQTPILVGPASKIRGRTCAQHNIDISGFELIDAPLPTLAGRRRKGRER